MNVKLVNHYTAPANEIKTANELLNPPEGVYDVNFVFPLRELESDKVRLVPFLPSVHMPLLHVRAQPHSELNRYTSFGPFPTLSSALEWHDQHIRAEPSATLFAVLDLTQADPVLPEMGGRLAGMTGLIGASTGQSQAEVAFVTYLPEFQRTHVGTHASGLLLRWLLDSPAQGGLGLKRVQ
ncbi:hypothetical protein DACRYDRAFT_15794 [Dacryopinax primogenitus]|uniref:N-acetyltransferase domain-containing protein n=1 Tax=Dacryopinax primogenitus (strain DJM 731) TaxID=1858805 RepID=M5G0W1_DACPD|nr:uncharacterized protein DACRYDRAFT_15794 [Dacryopinax primogenitus]EJU01775.1 hypothetical protein DACRYDRAFT_15794 [Dacryopinax primogenitus]